MKKLAILICLLCAPLALAQSTSAVLSWSAVTTFTDGKPVTGPVTYNVYSYQKSDPGKAYLVRSTDQLTTTRTGVSPGEWCWLVRAVVAGVESDPSPSACKVMGVVPASTTPAAPLTFTVN